MQLKSPNNQLPVHETGNKIDKKEGSSSESKWHNAKKKKTQEYNNFLRQDLPKVEFKKNNGVEVRCHSRQAKYLVDVTNSLSMQVPLLIIKCFPTANLHYFEALFMCVLLKLSVVRRSEKHVCF